MIDKTIITIAIILIILGLLYPQSEPHDKEHYTRMVCAGIWNDYREMKPTCPENKPTSPENKPRHY